MFWHRAGRIAAMALSALLVLSVTSCDNDEVNISDVSAPNGQVGTFYAVKFHANGGRAPLDWWVDSGEVPPGLSFSRGRRYVWLDGIPTVHGRFSFRLAVEDDGGTRASRRFEVMIHPTLVIGTDTLPDGEVDEAYSVTLQAAGGSEEDYVWTIVAGNLPSGLTLSAEGVLSGTPLTAGGYMLLIKVTDSAGNQTTRELSFEIVE